MGAPDNEDVGVFVTGIVITVTVGCKIKSHF